MTADGIEVTSYPELARKYRVSSVPKTVVSERLEFSVKSSATAPDSTELFGAPSGRRLEFSVKSSATAPRRHAGVVREFVGAGPESMLLKHVQEAAQGNGSPV